VSTNATEFERDLLDEWEGIEREDIPKAVTGIALELRQEAEDGSPVGSDFRSTATTRGRKDVWRNRAPGTLRSKWMAAPAQTKPLKDQRAEPGGHEAAAEALAGWRIGDPIFIFNNVFYGYWQERGTLHIPGLHFLQRALVSMRDVEVPVGDQA
jgi:hypothetical protein